MKNALCPHVMSLTMARSIYFARMHQEYAVKYGEGVCVYERAAVAYVTVQERKVLQKFLKASTRVAVCLT